MFDIAEKLAKPYKYQNITSRWLVRINSLIGLLCFSLVLYGFGLFLGASWLKWVFFGVPIIIFAITDLLTYFIYLFFPKFNVNSHEKFIKSYFTTTKPEEFPSVDVFLPVCGEDWEVLSRTWKAVKALNYPAEKVKVYVLDDGANSFLKIKATDFGFAYNLRKDLGNLKKAGNLRAGFDISGGDLIVIFDADFAPDEYFLQNTIPYFKDKSTALVQTPQYFNLSDGHHNSGVITYGAGYVQDEFYKYLQPARSWFNAAVCVGTNCVYRRESLVKIGGFPAIDHSEDIFTGIAIQGLKEDNQTYYLPLVLATGLCPDNFQSYLSQQIRWCKGTLELIYQKKFWQSKLSLIQKLCYLNGWFYYISKFSERVLMFIPLFVLISGTSVDFYGMLIFLPYALYIWFIKPTFNTFRENIKTTIMINLLSFIHAFAIFREVFGLKYVWQSSGSKAGKSVLSYQLFGFFVVFLILILALSAFALRNLNWNQQSFPLVFLLIWTAYYLIVKNLYTFGFLCKKIIFAR